MNAASRIAFGARIVTTRAALTADWERHRDDAVLSDDVAMKLCLIHPEWYGDFLGNQLDPRGPRRFTVPASVNQRCQCERIWGYECVLRSSPLHADHIYPYSAGGPTNAQNLVWLCEWHNRVKTDDIHLLPWDEMDWRWLEPALTRISEIRALHQRLGGA